VLARRSGSRSRTRTLPQVQPFNPVLRGVPFDDPAWIFEPKYDGFRPLTHVTPSTATFYSKRGLVLKRQ
jgi:bifunctional non-homologous end joining protein LigD